MKLPVAPVACMVLLLTACGEPATGPAPAAPATAPQPDARPAPAAAPAAPVETARPDASGRLRIEVGDQIRYSVTRFEVASGEKVRIELVHTGKLTRQAMGHNIVILQPGTDLDAFALRAVMARDSDHIPPDADAEILAHSKLIGGGETTTLEFVAPAAGTYRYLCSFPGHAVLMRGEMIVRPAAG